MDECEVRQLFGRVCIVCESISSHTSRARKSLRFLAASRSDEPPPKEGHVRLFAVDGPNSHSAVTQPAMLELRCERCHGHRSVSYHNKHIKDPKAFPRAGICSRRRTNCAATRSRCRKFDEGLPVIHELPANEATDRPEMTTKWPWLVDTTT